MTMSRTKSRFAWTAGIAAIIGVAAILPRVVASNADDVREIHLVVRNMTFYLEGHDDPNPTLYARRGERVRIRLSNRDPGMSHDFAVPSWKRSTALTDYTGEAAVEFTAPVTPEDATYSCTPHGEMMRGIIRIE